MGTQLWVALDVSSGDEAVSLVRELKHEVDVFKVGLELYTAAGNPLIERIHGEGGSVFLDLKLHDIPNTVAGAIRNITNLGVKYTDVHASGGSNMLRAALDAAEDQKTKAGLDARPQILAITLLTSLDETDLQQLGIDRQPKDLVGAWSIVAKRAGADGVVSSLHEVPVVKAKCGERFLCVTPGIRPKSRDHVDDQRRVGTPADAVSSGSGAIVVGRPIIEAPDPVVAARMIRSELESALKGT